MKDRNMAEHVRKNRSIWDVLSDVKPDGFTEQTNEIVVSTNGRDGNGKISGSTGALSTSREVADRSNKLQPAHPSKGGRLKKEPRTADGEQDKRQIGSVRVPSLHRLKLRLEIPKPCKRPSKNAQENDSAPNPNVCIAEDAPAHSSTVEKSPTESSMTSQHVVDDPGISLSGTFDTPATPNVVSGRLNIQTPRANCRFSQKVPTFGVAGEPISSDQTAVVLQTANEFSTNKVDILSDTSSDGHQDLCMDQGQDSKMVSSPCVVRGGTPLELSQDISRIKLESVELVAANGGNSQLEKTTSIDDSTSPLDLTTTKDRLSPEVPSLVDKDSSMPEIVDLTGYVEPLDLSLKKDVTESERNSPGTKSPVIWPGWVKHPDAQNTQSVLKSSNMSSTVGKRSGIFQALSVHTSPPFRKVSPVRPHIRGKPVSPNTKASLSSMRSQTTTTASVTISTTSATVVPFAGNERGENHTSPSFQDERKCGYGEKFSAVNSRVMTQPPNLDFVRSEARNNTLVLAAAAAAVGPSCPSVVQGPLLNVPVYSRTKVDSPNVIPQSLSVQIPDPCAPKTLPTAQVRPSFVAPEVCNTGPECEVNCTKKKSSGTCIINQDCLAVPPTSKLIQQALETPPLSQAATRRRPPNLSLTEAESEPSDFHQMPVLSPHALSEQECTVFSNNTVCAKVSASSTFSPSPPSLVRQIPIASTRTGVIQESSARSAAEQNISGSHTGELPNMDAVSLQSVLTHPASLPKFNLAPEFLAVCSQKEMSQTGTQWSQINQRLVLPSATDAATYMPITRGASCDIIGADHTSRDTNGLWCGTSVEQTHHGQQASASNNHPAGSGTCEHPEGKKCSVGVNHSPGKTSVKKRNVQLPAFTPTLPLSRKILQQSNAHFFTRLAFKNVPGRQKKRGRKGIMATKYYQMNVLGKQAQDNPGKGSHIDQVSAEGNQQMTQLLDNWQDNMFKHKRTKLRIPVNIITMPLAPTPKGFLVNGPSSDTLDLDTSNSTRASAGNALMCKLDGHNNSKTDLSPKKRKLEKDKVISTKKPRNSFTKLMKKNSLNEENRLSQEDAVRACQTLSCSEPDLKLTEVAGMEMFKVSKGVSVPPSFHSNATVVIDVDTKTDSNTPAPSRKRPAKIRKLRRNSRSPVRNSTDVIRLKRRRRRRSRTMQHQAVASVRPIDSSSDQRQMVGECHKASHRSSNNDAQPNRDILDRDKCLTEEGNRQYEGEVAGNCVQMLHPSNAEVAAMSTDSRPTECMDLHTWLQNQNSKNHLDSDCLYDSCDTKSCVSESSEQQLIKKRRSLLDQLISSDGFVGDKKRKTTDNLYVDPALLGREEKALQRAMLRFSQLEERRLLKAKRAMQQKIEEAAGTSFTPDSTEVEGNLDQTLDALTRSDPHTTSFPRTLGPRTRFRVAGKGSRKSVGQYHKDYAYERSLANEQKRLEEFRRIRRARHEQLVLGQNQDGDDGADHTIAGDAPQDAPKRAAHSSTEAAEDCDIAHIRDSPVKCDVTASWKSTYLSAISRRTAKRRQTLLVRKLRRKWRVWKRSKTSQSLKNNHDTPNEEEQKLMQISEEKDSRTREYTIISGGVEVEVPPEVKKMTICRETGENIMHKAARLGYKDVVSWCCQTGFINVNDTDNAGYAPLHECCIHNHIDTVQVLLEHGANVNVASRLDGVRPLHDCVEHDHMQIVRLLLACGADPTLSTYSGQIVQKLARTRRMRTFLTGYLMDVNGKKEMEDEIAWRFMPPGAHGTESDSDEDLPEVDVLAGVPSDVEDEQQQQQQQQNYVVTMEMSDRRLPPCYRLVEDQEACPRNCMLLDDILEHTALSRVEFQEKFPCADVRTVSSDCLRCGGYESRDDHTTLPPQEAEDASRDVDVIPLGSQLTAALGLQVSTSSILRVHTPSKGSVSQTRTETSCPPPPPSPVDCVPSRHHNVINCSSDATVEYGESSTNDEDEEQGEVGLLHAAGPPSSPVNAQPSLIAVRDLDSHPLHAHFDTDTSNLDRSGYKVVAAKYCPLEGVFSDLATTSSDIIATNNNYSSSSNSSGCAELGLASSCLKSQDSIARVSEFTPSSSKHQQVLMDPTHAVIDVERLVDDGVHSPPRGSSPWPSSDKTDTAAATANDFGLKIADVCSLTNCDPLQTFGPTFQFPSPVRAPLCLKAGRPNH